MNIGVLGLGHIGFPIAQTLHAEGHHVFSWSKTPHEYPWQHSISVGTIAAQHLDYLLVASGSARPGSGDYYSEIESTLELIPISMRNENTRILYLSSGAVYGECHTPKSEADSIFPNTSYGKSKALVEREFDQIFAGRFSSLRIGNIFDWEKSYGILSMAKKAKQTRSLIFYGNPDDCRDYLSIDELCLMVSRMIEFNSTEKLVNLGSGISISLHEFGEIFSRAIPSLRIQWSPRRSFDVSRTQLDVSKARNMTHVYPTDPRKIFFDYLRLMI